MNALPSRDELALLGQLTRPVGLRGQMRFRLLADEPGWLDSLDASQIYLLLGDASPLPARIRFSGTQGGSLLAAIEGVDTPEEARKYCLAWLAIPETERPALEPGAFYPDELVGMRVEDCAGREVGRVAEILQSQNREFLSIKGGAQDFLLPPERSLIERIDREARLLRLRFQGF